MMGDRPTRRRLRRAALVASLSVLLTACDDSFGDAPEPADGLHDRAGAPAADFGEGAAGQRTPARARPGNPTSVGTAPRGEDAMGAAPSFDGDGAVHDPPEIPEACIGLLDTRRELHGALANTNGMASALHARELLREGRAPSPEEIQPSDFPVFYRLELQEAEEPGTALAPEEEAAPTPEEEAEEEAELDGGVEGGAPVHGEAMDAGAPEPPPVPAAEAPRVAVQLRQSTLVAESFDLLVAVQAPPRSERPPLSLMVVVDRTQPEEGLLRSRAVLEAIAGQLTPEDRIAWIPTAGEEVEILNDPSALAEAAASLERVEAGALATTLAQAYAALDADLEPAVDHRVLLLTGGDAASGDGVAGALSAIEAGAERRAFLVVAATGPASRFRHRHLGEASRLGRGPFVYVDGVETAADLLGTRFDEIFGVAYDDVTVRVELPGYFEVEQDSSTALTDEPHVPQLVAPGASLPFRYALRACDASVVAGNDTLSVEVSWAVVATKEPRRLSSAMRLADARAEPAADLYKLKGLELLAAGLRGLDRKRLEASLGLFAESRREAESAGLPVYADLDELEELVVKHPLLAEP